MPCVKTKPYRINSVLALCFLAYSTVYMGRLNLSVAMPLLQEENIVDTAAAGLLGSMFFFVYAFGRIVSGYIGDRVSPKLLLTGGLLGAGLANLLFGCLPPVPVLFLLWGLNGLFQSTLWGPALRLAAGSAETEAKRSRAVMILSCSVGAGNLLAVGVSVLLSRYGARQVFLLPGAVMSLTAVIVALFLRTPARTSAALSSSEAPPKITAVLHDRCVLSMILPAMAHGAVKDNLSLWLPVLFIEMYQTDLTSVWFYILLMPAATLLGRILFPPLYQACHGNELAAACVSFIVCAAALVPLLSGTPPMILTAVLLAVVSVTTSTVNASFLSIYPVRYQKQNLVSSVAGLMDCATYMGSAVSSALFGAIIAGFGFRSMLAAWFVLSVLCAAAMRYVWHRAAPL